MQITVLSFRFSFLVYRFRSLPIQISFIVERETINAYDKRITYRNHINIIIIHYFNFLEPYLLSHILRNMLNASNFIDFALKMCCKMKNYTKDELLHPIKVKSLNV